MMAQRHTRKEVRAQRRSPKEMRAQNVLKRK